MKYLGGKGRNRSHIYSKRTVVCIDFEMWIGLEEEREGEGDVDWSIRIIEKENISKLIWFLLGESSYKKSIHL